MNPTSPAQPPTPPAPPTPPPTNPAQPATSSGQKKILIIEDEAFIADLYARQLSLAGYIVKTANDGISGLKLLETEPFDLLLQDIMLPGLNGLEVIKQWREKSPQSTMPILLLTNLGQDAVIKAGFALGVQGYLIKASYTPDQVVSEVRNALEGKAAGSPNPSAA